MKILPMNWRKLNLKKSLLSWNVHDSLFPIAIRKCLLERKSWFFNTETVGNGVTTNKISYRTIVQISIQVESGSPQNISARRYFKNIFSILPKTWSSWHKCKVFSHVFVFNKSKPIKQNWIFPVRFWIRYNFVIALP